MSPPPLLLSEGLVRGAGGRRSTRMVGTEQDRQVVVATDHLRVVGAELGAGQVEKTEANGPLGLTLVTLRDVAEAGRALTERREAEFPQARGPEATTDLDRVLTEVRCLCEQRFTAWHPTIGKNRTLTGVQFEPYTNGFDKPTPDVAPTPARPVEQGGSRVRVGLYDTRLAPHRQLTGSFLADDGALLGAVAPGRQRLWWEGHATFIAGIIRRHAPSAVLDVRAALRPAGSAPAEGAGDPTTDEYWALPVWDFATTLAAYQSADLAVLNLSVGLFTQDGRPPLVLERAIAQLTPNTIVVAAAGNHGAERLPDAPGDDGLPGRGAPLFPAALDNVLAVGALGPDGAPATFNPRGATPADIAPWIDVCAPGVDTVSAYLGATDGEKVLVRDVAGAEEVV